MASLWEMAPGRGRKPTYSPDKIKIMLDATLQVPPGDDPLELSNAGEGSGREQVDGEQYLAEPQP